MHNVLGLRCVATLAAMALLSCNSALSHERTVAILDAARDELQAARLPEDEMQVRLKILENVATVKAYYPHANGRRPEYRNPKYWKLNQDGSYIPRGSAAQAIRDLWQTESGIRCAKLSALVMVKALIDVADTDRLTELEDMLRGKVIPNELPKKGVGTLFDKPKEASSSRRNYSQATKYGLRIPTSGD